MKTFVTKPAEVSRKWYLVDATDKVLGRLASEVASILRGKHKPNFTPHVDCGDNIIIINADKVRLTGNKLTDKVYVRHTGYPSGQRFSTPKELLQKQPIKIIEHAVKGMLPKNKLGSQLYRNLYVYEGTEHKQAAQQPKVINIKDIK
ncbi:MAG TPA: 50S ribosomal protein L13 [Bacteroidales bacterium]|nr:50S ribosomal protein L13 [Bacteroidales bacterium]